MIQKKLFSISTLLPVFTALAVCLFWGLCYPHHLHYQEQFQLFLFDWDYAREVLSAPGGLADYLGRFATQFYLYAWVGAIILAVLIALIQALVAKVSNQGKHLWLSLFTPLFLMRMLCDENSLTGSVFALLLTLLAAWLVTSLSHCTTRCTLALLLVPVLYWMAGPVAILYVALLALHELKQACNLGTAAYVATVGIVALALPAFLAQFLPFETQHLYIGIHYFRTHDVESSNLWWALLFAFIPAIGVSLWKKGSKNALSNQAEAAKSYNWKSALMALIVACAGSAALIYPQVNSKAETVMAYDFMARMQLWNRMQLTAQKQAPNNALCATALNLALAKTGILGERMFYYQQKGLSGLLPEMSRDAMSPLTPSEVYYHLGMINTAQRYVFEAQEAILDYQKSGRCYKRLAETNLIEGNYAVARKYLMALQKTLFYKDWANQTLALLGNEEAINNHPEYGPLRQNRFQDDEFFANNNYALLLQKLYESNKQNRMAFEYTLAACMLQKDLTRFHEVLSMNNAIHYNSLPMHFQEALIMWWSSGAGEKLPPSGIRQDLEGRLKQLFIDIDKYRNNRKTIEKHYGNTYWFYYLYK